MNGSRRAPWLAAAYGLGHLLMALPMGLLLTMASVSLGMSVIGVGMLLVPMWAPAVRYFAELNAQLAASYLRTTVEVPRLTISALNPWRQAMAWFRQRAFWQLVLWLVFACSVGLVLSALTTAAPFGVVALLATAFGLGVAGGAPIWVPVLLTSISVVVAGLWWFWGEVPLRCRTRIEAAILRPDPQAALERRVADLTASRADTVDASAAELRRIERDLHDGAQARLVALGMNLGMIADLMERDPAAAQALLDEARATHRAALGDLRSVVRGIHPPVLADRGLIGAVQALALDLPLPVTVDAALPQRLAAPLESAAYFAVAECLANVVKHARAREAWVVIAAPDYRLRLIVGDDGVGGAEIAGGSGLAGLQRRLAAFDGTLAISSPPAGPTVITMELPTSTFANA